MINQRIILPILFGIFTFLSSTSLYADQMDEDWVEQGSREEGLMMNNEIQNSTYKDPFKRGITRSPAFATFGSKKEVQYRLDDLRHLSDIQYYRVVSIIQDEEKSRVNILKLFEQGFYGDEYQAYYVRISGSTELQDMEILANNMKNNYYQSLNRNLIIRNIMHKDKTNFALEYGPFSNPEIALANCHYIKVFSMNSNLDCKKTIFRHFVSSEEVEEAESIATVSMSQFALLDIKNKPFEFDIEQLKNTSIDVMVDQPLGPHGFFITNINDMGVTVSGLNGDVIMIPTSTLPIPNKAMKPSAAISQGSPEAATN